MPFDLLHKYTLWDVNVELPIHIHITTVKPVENNATTLIWYLKNRLDLLFLKAHETNAEV